MFRNKKNQYSNFRFAHFRIPTIWILNIVCLQIKNCTCSDFIFPIFGILKILCPMFVIKEHHIFRLSIPQSLICDISNLGRNVIDSIFGYFHQEVGKKHIKEIPNRLRILDKLELKIAEVAIETWEAMCNSVEVVVNVGQKVCENRWFASKNLLAYAITYFITLVVVIQ